VARTMLPTADARCTRASLCRFSVRREPIALVRAGSYADPVRAVNTMRADRPQLLVLRVSTALIRNFTSQSNLADETVVREALDVLKKNLARGDRDIDIIGFSRGAAGALHFANQIWEKIGDKQPDAVPTRFIGAPAIIRAALDKGAKKRKVRGGGHHSLLRSIPGQDEARLVRQSAGRLHCRRRFGRAARRVPDRIRLAVCYRVADRIGAANTAAAG
jgi:hypothetical protein